MESQINLDAEVVIIGLTKLEKELIAMAYKQREAKREFNARSLEDESIGVWKAICFIKELIKTS